MSCIYRCDLCGHETKQELSELEIFLDGNSLMDDDMHVCSATCVKKMKPAIKEAMKRLNAAGIIKRTAGK